MQHEWTLVSKDKPKQGQRVFVSDGYDIRIAVYGNGIFAGVEAKYTKYDYPYWTDTIPLPPPVEGSINDNPAPVKADSDLDEDKGVSHG
jgi:hypothetical protein